jgi:hypothetical protein
LRALRQARVKNLVFLTADAHHAEVIRHQITPDWAVHDLMAGPLAAEPGRPQPLDLALNPRSLFALGGIENFGHARIDATGLSVRIVDNAGRVRFSHAIKPEPGD